MAFVVRKSGTRNAYVQGGSKTLGPRKTAQKYKTPAGARAAAKRRGEGYTALQEPTSGAHKPGQPSYGRTYGAKKTTPKKKTTTKRKAPKTKAKRGKLKIF